MTSVSQPTLSTPLYEVRNVSKSYGSVVALDHANLAIHAGEVVGLVGYNGACKSTLVKIVSGALQPNSGSIFLEGVERSWRSPHEAIEAGMETLYQDSGLAPHLSVSANVFLGREVVRPGILGWLGFLAQKTMDEIAYADLERVGIAVPNSNRSVSQLSGGQRQAVAIGRAASWARQGIILDEPTNHLGARQSGEVPELIKAAKAKGSGGIFIPHTLPHVMPETERTVVPALVPVVSVSS